MTTPILLALTLLGADPIQRDDLGRYELFTSEGEVFVRAGAKQGLKVGVELAVKGGGTAVVMEVWETKARVSLDAAAKKSGGTSVTLSTPACPETEAEDVSYGFSVNDDALVARCCDTRVRVLVHGTTLGAALKLYVDGKLVDQREPVAGTEVVLKGKNVAFSAKVGSFGGSYALKVGGKPCQLSKE
jgi:hypothetical protein